MAVVSLRLLAALHETIHIGSVEKLTVKPPEK